MIYGSASLSFFVVVEFDDFLYSSCKIKNCQSAMILIFKHETLRTVNHHVNSRQSHWFIAIPFESILCALGIFRLRDDTQIIIFWLWIFFTHSILRKTQRNQHTRFQLREYFFYDFLGSHVCLLTIFMKVNWFFFVFVERIEGSHVREKKK